MAYRSKSRAMRNLKSATSSILRTTGKASMKGAESTAKWMATDHIGAAESSKLMEMWQEVNYAIASVNLSRRRMDRLTYPNHIGIYAVISGWVIDHSIYLLEILWGFIWPIVAYILWTIFTLVMIALLYILMFYFLHLFITS
jgi:hypothetical protein